MMNADKKITVAPPLAEAVLRTQLHQRDEQIARLEGESKKWNESCRKLDQKCERLESQFSQLTEVVKACEVALGEARVTCESDSHDQSKHALELVKSALALIHTLHRSRTMPATGMAPSFENGQGELRTLGGMEGMNLIDGLDYRSPNDLMNRIHSGEIKLPVPIRIGHSFFTVREETKETFALACLFATDPEWDRGAG
jgi:hypothetical protein